MDSRMTWLLDEKWEEAGVNDLAPAIKAQGDQYFIISRQEARLGTEMTIPLHSHPTLAYGSIQFARALRSDFYPGKWCDWTALRCERYYPQVSDFLLNDDYILLPAGEVIRRQDALLEMWGQIFVRPVRADKPFSGFVATREHANEIERVLAEVETHELVALARPKQIQAEYRAVVVRSQGVIAVSQYMEEGALHLKPEMPVPARQVAEAVVQTLGEGFPDPMFVVDIALCQGDYRLLEINSFSASLFYACDLNAIVRAAHGEALREWQTIQV